jgi:1-deoxy-D-xylulose-5-phosphate synthase
VHDIALQNLDVTLAVDRGGLVGEDGATHAGCFDLSFARPLPNLIIMAPADEAECRRLLQTALAHPGPAMVRYPRGKGPGVAVSADLTTVPIGQGRLLIEGQRVALLAFGRAVQESLAAGGPLQATVADMRFIKPLDEALLQRLASQHELLVTVEENMLQGGAGSAVNERLAALGARCRVLNLGIPDRFIEHATPAQQLAECGLDQAGIIAAVRHALDHPANP